MQAAAEFHYRLGARVGGYWPGSHRGVAVGAGQDFAGYARLFDVPDPRRLDLRASIRDPRGDWLVRTYRQRAAMSLNAVVDLSMSMDFGARASKLHVAADFVESMGRSAFSVGDAAGMVTFASQQAAAARWPARYGRGTGLHLASRLREQSQAQGQTSRGRRRVDHAASLADAVKLLPASNTLVFLVSDFHWPLAELKPVLDRLSLATVVPVVVWDPAETDPPMRNGLLTVRDAESGGYRPMWVNDKARTLWRAGVAARRADIDAVFRACGLAPHYVNGSFNPEALSRYFLEHLS